MLYIYLEANCATQANMDKVLNVQNMRLKKLLNKHIVE